MTIAILANVAKAGFQFYQGQKQKKMANNLKAHTYIPPAIQEAEANARMQAGSSVAPGYDRFMDKLKTQSANTIAAASRSTNNPNVVQQSVMDADARNKELIKDIEVNNQSWRAQNMDKLNRTLGIKGSFEKDSFDDYNATKSALLGSSMQNKFNAVSGMAEAATYSSAINKMYGDGEKTKLTETSAIKNPFKGLFKRRPASGSGGGFGSQAYPSMDMDPSYYGG